MQSLQNDLLIYLASCLAEDGEIICFTTPDVVNMFGVSWTDARRIIHVLLAEGHIVKAEIDGVVMYRLNEGWQVLG